MEHELYLKASHCGAIFLVQVQAHICNMAFFNMQMVPHIIWWPNFKVAVSSTFADNKRLIKHEAVENDQYHYPPCMFLRQARLMPALKGYKVSSRSENEIQKTSLFDCTTR